PPGFFVDAGGGSSVDTSSIVVRDGDATARPGQMDDDEVLGVTFAIPAGGWGSIGQTFADDGGPIDLRGTDGFRLWLHGQGSGASYQREIMASRSDPAPDASERFGVDFVDDQAGWQLREVWWEDFTRAMDWQPAGAPDAGLTLDEIWGWAIP